MITKAKSKIHHGGTAQPSRNQKAKPTTEALRHGEKPEKTSCTAEARRRGEEFNFVEKFVQKTRKFEISNTAAPELHQGMLENVKDLRGNEKVSEQAIQSDNL